MVRMNTIMFEKCSKCNPSEWSLISIDDLIREMQEFEIDLILYTKVPYEKGLNLYRRYIPEDIADWAIINRKINTPPILERIVGWIKQLSQKLRIV